MTTQEIRMVQVVSEDGRVDEAQEPKLTKQQVFTLYQTLIRLRTFEAPARPGAIAGVGAGHRLAGWSSGWSPRGLGYGLSFGCPVSEVERKTRSLPVVTMRLCDYDRVPPLAPCGILGFRGPPPPPDRGVCLRRG